MVERQTGFINGIFLLLAVESHVCILTAPCVKICFKSLTKNRLHRYNVKISVYLTNKRAMMALGRSPEYHWNQIISKSVHRFSRRSRLELFCIYSPGGHFVQQRLSGTV